MPTKQPLLSSLLWMGKVRSLKYQLIVLCFPPESRHPDHLSRRRRFSGQL